MSLTSLCCKVQENIIVSNILRHVEEHDILTDCQHGFRARRSCETQMITLVHELADPWTIVDNLIWSSSTSQNHLIGFHINACWWSYIITVWEARHTTGSDHSLRIDVNRLLLTEQYQTRPLSWAVCHKVQFSDPYCFWCSSMTCRILCIRDQTVCRRLHHKNLQECQIYLGLWCSTRGLEEAGYMVRDMGNAIPSCQM